jgi:hypothetical protein
MFENPESIERSRTQAKLERRTITLRMQHGPWSDSQREELKTIAREALKADLLGLASRAVWLIGDRERVRKQPLSEDLGVPIMTIWRWLNPDKVERARDNARTQRHSPSRKDRH